jgi:hypothetical protein
MSNSDGVSTGVHQRRWDDGRTLLRTSLGTEIEGISVSVNASLSALMYSIC